MSLLDAQGPSGSQPDGGGKSDSPLKKALPYTTILLIIAILYVAYTFYSRHQADVSAEASLAAKQEEARKKTVDAVFGDGEIKFTSFALSTSAIERGQSARLCYGVVNATTVKMDPPVEELKPTYQHCMGITPKQTTKYTITASDVKGNTKSESLELKVR